MSTGGILSWLKSIVPSVAIAEAKHCRQAFQRFVYPAHAPRSMEPISRVHGFDRGVPIDRYYIGQFLSDCRDDIRGHVLEIGDPTYTYRYGGDRVNQSSVLHAAPDNRKATIVGDLQTGTGLPDGAFDCIILTQTLPFIFDIFSAVKHLYRSLAEGGVALVTVSGIAPICRFDMERWGDYWRFTPLSLQRLLGTAFDPDSITVNGYGNVRSSIAFLEGLAQEELTSAELDHHDDDYPMIVTARAVKKPATARS